ncbi:hypothetical protein ACIQU2_27510 [Pseudomonas sp. NPDC098740]|uniref:hypothetical protein n=1 Tax=Pseudomonas sp. NPDC098740 TaxID=3364486 RepID=UPI00383B426B
MSNNAVTFLVVAEAGREPQKVVAEAMTMDRSEVTFWGDHQHVAARFPRAVSVTIERTDPVPAPGLSETKPNETVFVIVDRAGLHHSVTADRMLTEGREVTFTVAGREVGSFFDPMSAKLATFGDAAEVSDLVPGMACVTNIQSTARGLVPVSWALVGVVAALACLKVYELFWFGG